MEERDQLEDYLKGKPLTPQLEKLQRGEDEDDVDPRIYASAANMARDTRELDDDDRQHLRRLTVEPGWPILFRLLDGAIGLMKQGAEAASMDNPLGNRDQVAELWADVAAMKRARDLFVRLVEGEVQKLNLPSARDLDVVAPERAMQ
jgi:hypothetical protein